ncbi:MAG: rod shape-determining protein RodA [Bacteroidales bacterium]
MTRQINIFKNIDKTVLFLFLALVTIGWVNIFASEYTGSYHHIFDLGTSYGKQFIWVLGAFILAAAVLTIDIRFFTSFSWIIYVSLLLVLIGVLFFGVEINATRAWFRVGGFAFQPSEIAKYGTILALAAFISKVRAKKPGFFTRMKAFGIVLLPAVLVLLQKDVGTTLVFASFILVLFREGYIGGLVLFFGAVAVVLFILTLVFNEFIIIGSLAVITLAVGFLMRKKNRVIPQLIGLFLLLAAFVYSVDYTFENALQPHHKARIEVLLHGGADLQGAGYNLRQSKIAIGSGGFAGKGFLQGTQTQFDFIPEQSTDFIFCTVGEEWGFIGSLVIIGLYTSLLLRLLYLAEKQRSTFSRVFGYATLSILFFHFAINIGMTIGVVPVIGIPLPLISYGGSSLWGVTLMLFTFLKLDAHRLEMM